MEIVICDDDPIFAGRCKARLEALGRKHAADVNVLVAGPGRQLLFDLDTRYAKADLILMDYHMPEINGMETARILRGHDVTADIVFYTMDADHALESYDVDALHYIVKDKTDSARFEEMFLKALRSYNRRHRERISLTCAGERRMLDVPDILYFEVRDRIVTVHYLAQGKPESFEFYSTLSRLEELLAESQFLRIHKAYLVSARYIMKKTMDTVVLRDKTVLPVGRTYQGRI